MCNDETLNICLPQMIDQEMMTYSWYVPLTQPHLPNVTFPGTIWSFKHPGVRVVSTRHVFSHFFHLFCLFFLQMDVHEMKVFPACTLAPKDCALPPQYLLFLFILFRNSKFGISWTQTCQGIECSSPAASRMGIPLILASTESNRIFFPRSLFTPQLRLSPSAI